MNATDLMMECSAVARVLGRANVMVEFGGTDAWNDGKTVHLPELPTGTLKPALVAVARGFTDHETAHSLYSDFDLTKDLPPELFDAFNFLEDPRVERRYQRVYPGAYASFNELRKVTAAKQISTLHMAGSIPWHKLVAASAKWIASEMMEHGGENQQSLTAMIPPEIRAIAERYAVRAMDAKDSAEVLELAKELVKEDVPKQESPKPEPEGGSEGEDGQEDGQEGDGKTPDSQQDSGQGDGQEDGTGEQGERAGEGAEAMPKIIGEGGALTDLAAWDHVGTPRYNPHLCVMTPSCIARYCGALEKGTAVTITPMGGHAKATLRRALVGVDDSRWLGGHVSGQLDQHDLARAYMGAEDVYQRRTSEPEINAAVTLLIDMSQSMAGDRAQQAAKTALMLAETLEALSVPVEILGHTTLNLSRWFLYHKADVTRAALWAWENRHPQLAQMRFAHTDQTGARAKGGKTGKVVEATAAKAVQAVREGRTLTTDEGAALSYCVASAPGYASSDPLVMFELLNFGARLRNTREVIAKLPSLINYYGGNNIDGRAIEFASQRLIKTGKQIKLLLVLCDGIPLARGLEFKALIPMTKAAAEAAQAEGVSVIAVGFGESQVARLFSDHVTLGSIGQMEDAVLSIVKAVLTSTRKGKRAAA